MDQTERAIIDDLFARLAEAARRAGPRDAEAEELIRRHLASLPSAPYHMAQAIVVQQQALARAQARLEQLEREAEGAAGGGFLGGLFGGERRPAPGPDRRWSGPGPWSPAGGQSGGFLAGAAQTAMGVAGGVLIADAIAGMLGPDPAAAAEPGAHEEPGTDAGFGDDEAAGDAGDIGFDEF